MGNLESFILLFVLSAVLDLVYASENCPVSSCISDNIPIRFPFRLKGQQTESCGYPGFDLRCNNQSKTVVRFPYDGEFLVRDIYYTSQQIQLYDLSNCLPKRLMSLNLSGSPLVPEAYQNYTFLRCPTELVESRFVTISCLSNSTSSVVATSSLSIVNSLSTICTIMGSFLVPVSLSGQRDEGFSSQLDEDLELTWYSPDCGECEANSGICGFESNTSQTIGCFNNRTGKSSTALRTLRVVWLSIATPFVIIICGIAIFTILMLRSRPPVTNRVNQDMPLPAAALESPQPQGLDESTIESYQKVILGDSMRLPVGPNNNTCAICLAEYHSQDVLRCIPECNHCFHAGCIDEWLRLHSSCPVCRKSPAPSPSRAVDVP